MIGPRASNQSFIMAKHCHGKLQLLKLVDFIAKFMITVLENILVDTLITQDLFKILNH